MNNIRKLRKEKNLTMKEFGVFMGVAESTISLYENEKREPEFAILDKMANFFGVTIDYLLGRDTAPSSSPSTPPTLQEQTNLTDDQKRLLRVYEELTPPMQEYLIETAENLAAKQNTRKKFNS